VRDDGRVIDSAPPPDLLAAPTVDAADGFVERVGEGAALDAAARWVTAADPRFRQVGFAVLGFLGLGDDDARLVLLDAARVAVGDPDPDVRLSVAAAVGNLSDCADAHQLLLSMVGESDEWVLAQVVGGLPITACGFVSVADPWIQALLTLLRHHSPRVRNWAAFAIGTQSDADSLQLRDELFRIAETDVDGEDVYPAAEAAMGLARRHDARVESIIERRLADVTVGKLWLDAAAELAAPRLHPALVRLREEVDPEPRTLWDDSLDLALQTCTPLRDRSW
jgi:HEAT repeat protein